MAIKTAFNLVRSAFEIAGAGAPTVLARYVRLTLLNRTSRRRAIAKVPEVVEGTTEPADRADKPRGEPGDVVIPVYNAFEDTRGLLEALKKEADGLGSIIIVHDCSSDDRIAPLLKEFRDEVPRARLLENERNLGFVETCNRGLEAATRDVIILNTDIELPPGALGRMLEILRSSKDIATVTPFSNSAYGVGFPDLNYFNERPFNATSEEVDKAFQTLANLAPIEIPRGVGFCMAISADVIANIGTFSRDFAQGYGEEADFCMRAGAAGFSNVIAPNAYVFHKGGQSFGGTWQTKARAGQIRFLSRHPQYPAMVQAYLEANEARALGFAALIALTRLKSTRGPEVKTESKGKAVVAFVSLGEETHSFEFANAETARQAFEFAGLELT